MTEKRYSHDAIVIVDHLKKDLIYIDGKDDLLELAEYVDRLQEENEQLQNYKQFVSDLIDEKIKKYPYLTLTEKWDKNCKYYHSCRENHEKNVAYASRHMLLQELKKELEE